MHSWLLPQYPDKMNLKICEGAYPENTCRYLCKSKNKLPACAKLNADIKEIIDEEVSLYLTMVAVNCQKYDPNLPTGDNCPGVRSRGVGAITTVKGIQLFAE